MTLQELQNELLQCDSLAAADTFLSCQLHEVRPLFYGLTRGELLAQSIEYESTFLSIINSSAGREIQQGELVPGSVIALLIFFFSFFERAGLYVAVQSVANLLPPGSLCSRAQAVFEYKNITDAARNYLDRSDRILSLLSEAWQGGTEMQRRCCEDMVREYILDARILPHRAGIDISDALEHQVRTVAAAHHPILESVSAGQIFALDGDRLLREHAAVRSRIVEALHAEACDLAPEVLLAQTADELAGEDILLAQSYAEVPPFIDDQLEAMGARHSPQRQGARFNFDSSPDRNRIYLGTYFPKTVIESWNIFSELLSVPVVSASFAQKDVIRLLDVGSGTGAAVVGMLLALRDWGRCQVPVEVTSLDINEDALAKQGEILESLRPELPFELHVDLRRVELPFDLDGFVPAFSSIAEQEGHRYDFITCWKCLCEFYNVNFAQAQGIIRNTIQIASRMLVPYGACVLADVTTTDNGYEYFAMTLNRESNAHDQASDSRLRTILPLPCGRHSATCGQTACYTQRHFAVAHQLARGDSTSIAYRVLAPIPFADSITATFSNHPCYRVNAARPHEACLGGDIRSTGGTVPCGYTGFFAEGE